MDKWGNRDQLNWVNLGLVLVLLGLSIGSVFYSPEDAGFGRPVVATFIGPFSPPPVPTLEPAIKDVNLADAKRVLAEEEPELTRRGEWTCFWANSGAATPGRELMCLYAVLKKHPRIKKLKAQFGDAIFGDALNFAVRYDVSTETLGVWSSSDNELGLRGDYEEYRHVTPTILRDAYVDHSTEAVLSLPTYGCFHSQSVSWSINRRAR